MFNTSYYANLYTNSGRHKETVILLRILKILGVTREEYDTFSDMGKITFIGDSLPHLSLYDDHSIHINIRAEQLLIAERAK